MANTFSQIHLQFVFAVQHRDAVIPQRHKEALHKYFTGFRPTIDIPDFVKEIKAESNEFFKDKKWIKGKYNWQEGVTGITIQCIISA